MHLILTGATGLIGSAVLRNMLAMDEVTRISILSRSPVLMSELNKDKTNVIIHKDFNKYEAALLEELKDAEGCVWALGVSQLAVSKTEYFEITHDYTLAAAKAFSSLHPDRPFKFVFVSSEGATQSPGILTSHHGKIKGQVEAELMAFSKTTPNFPIYNVRPGAVDWTVYPEIRNYMPTQPIWKRVFLPVLPVINTVHKDMITPVKQLGRVLADLAMSKGEPLEGKGIEGEGRTISNVGLRRIMGL